MAKKKFETLDIEVKASDIKKGEPGSPYWCPIALAVKRRVGKRVLKKFPVSVVLGVEFDKEDGDTIIAPLPVRAHNFVTKFDYGEPVKPFSFKLKVPVEVLA